MLFCVSPKSSPSSPFLSLGFPHSEASMSSISSTSSQSSTRSTSSTTSSKSLSCAYPSWPSGSTLRTFANDFSSGSSHLSDEDLFGGDLLSSCGTGLYLDRAPSPPREYAQPVTIMPLAPLYAMAKAEKKSRRRASRRPASRAGQLTPIIESVTTTE